ncbi:MAG: HAMP domain-containing protein [Bacillus sp. (in: Bacteria)]|nr:HAMP domain-containing protein [Bacillus sp. (in: firmicutes)]
MFKTNKIFTKLFFSYISIICFSFLLFGFVLIYLFHINLYNNFEDTFHHYHEQVENQLQTSQQYTWTKEESTAAVLPMLFHKDFSIFIFDEDNNLSYSPVNVEAAMLTIDENLLDEAVAKRQVVSKGGMEDGALLYSLAAPIALNGSGDPNGVMVMIYHDLSHEYYQMMLMIVITFFITIVIAGIVIWVISRKITEPLRHMNRIALSYAKGDFSPLVKVTSKDEIGQLGTTFNYMADELNRLEETRKDFIANLSHDLRSPLTSIKGFLIAMLDGTIPCKKRDHYYLLMKDETERVIKLINDTLDMSQLEAGQIQIKKTSYNITKQLQMVVAKLEPQLLNKQLKINIQAVNGNITVFADRDRIEQALVNLLENAMQFSHSNGVINVLLQVQEKQRFNPYKR